MDQLMSELRIQGGNFKFTFDHPVFARVTTDVTPETGSSQPQIEHFASKGPRKEFDLYFSSSPMFVGQTPIVGEDRKMLVNLSGCPATAGTRIIYYKDELQGNGVAMYRPDIPNIPEIGKQYILHWYFKKGEEYHAKAVIEFSDTSFPND